MGVYDINVNGYDLKVRVADHAEMISQGISELRSQITWTMPIVGINIFGLHDAYYNSLLLQLCVGNRCLVVVSRYVNPFPVSLKEFLDHPDICFVGVKMDSGQTGLRTNTYQHEFARGMELKELAARALKKPNLLDGRPFSEVAAEVGICLDNSGDFQVLKELSSTIRVFSHEQIKCLARYPHATYLIGQKMLSLL